MKTLFININGKDVQSTESLVVIGDKSDAIIDSFFVALGEEIVAGSHVRNISHMAIVKDYALDKPEEFEPVLQQWEDVKEILLSNDPTGEYSVKLPSDYLRWLRYNDNDSYREVFEKKYADKKEVSVSIDIDSLYLDSLASIRRKVVRFWEIKGKTEDIEDFVINDDYANGKSKFVLDIREKLEGIAFLRFNQYEEQGVENTEEPNGKANDSNASVQRATDEAFVKIKYIVPTSGYDDEIKGYKCMLLNSEGKRSYHEEIVIPRLDNPYTIFDYKIHLIKSYGLLPICDSEAFVSINVDPTRCYCFVEFPDAYDIYDVSKEAATFLGELPKPILPDSDEFEYSECNLKLERLSESGFFMLNEKTYELSSLQQVLIPGFCSFLWIGKINGINFFVASNNDWTSAFIVDIQGKKYQRTAYNPYITVDSVKYSDENKRWEIVEESDAGSCNEEENNTNEDFSVVYDSDNGEINYILKSGNNIIKSGKIKIKELEEPYLPCIPHIEDVEPLFFPFFRVIRRSNRGNTIYEHTYNINGKLFPEKGDFTLKKKTGPLYVFAKGYWVNERGKKGWWRTYLIYDSELNALSKFDIWEFAKGYGKLESFDERNCVIAVE